MAQFLKESDKRPFILNGPCSIRIALCYKNANGYWYSSVPSLLIIQLSKLKPRVEGDTVRSQHVSEVKGLLQGIMVDEMLRVFLLGHDCI